MKRVEALAIVGMLLSAYPRQQMGDDNVKTYATLIEDLDGLACRDAAMAWARSERWFPAAAELRARVLAGRVLPASDAWAEVLAAVRSRGWPNPPGPEDWSTPAIPRALATLGAWQDVCASENMVADRAHFLKAYEAQVLDAVRVETATASLAPSVARSIEESGLDLRREDR